MNRRGFLRAAIAAVVTTPALRWAAPAAPTLPPIDRVIWRNFTYEYEARREPAHVKITPYRPRSL